MITLAEIKSFLKITGSTLDSVLTAFIASAKKRADSLTNRKLEYQLHTDYYEGNGTSEMYLKQSPVALADISTLKYYDDITNTYINLIDGSTGGVTDTIANTCEVINDCKLILNKGYTFSGRIQIVYYGGYKATKVYKTISAITQSTTYALVTIGTHSYTAGEVFYIDGVTGFLNNPNGARVIEDVTATQVKFTFDLGTGSYTSGGTAEFESTLTNTTPDDLKQVLYELTTEIFYKSPQGKGWIGVSGINVGSQVAESFTLKETDWTKNDTIITYRKWQI